MTGNSKTHASKQERIDALKAELALLEGEKKSVTAKELEGYQEEENKISPDEYIKIMSIIPHHLNISTRERGQGKTFKFDHFGQVKRILYSDLVDILEVQPKFVEWGYFYILSPKVIRHHGLDDIYSKILTKEKIEEVLSGEGKNVDTCMSLYNSANDGQKEIIISLMIDKLVENPNSLDLNFVDRISRLSGINIAEKAKDTKEIFSPEKE